MVWKSFIQQYNMIKKNATSHKAQSFESKLNQLQEEADQAIRMQKLWQNAGKQLKNARDELIRIQAEKEATNQELEARVLELKEANEFIQRNVYNDKFIVENMQEGVLVTDANRCIKAVNRAFTEITGYNMDEIVGKTPSIIKSDQHDDAFYQNVWQTIGKQGKWQGEIHNKKKSGEIYTEWLSINEIRNWKNVVINYIGVFTDITEKKRYQGLLNQAMIDADAANHHKIDFLASISHQIRTPLNAVLGMTELLIHSGLDEKQQQYADTAFHSSELLLSLLNDIFDYSKISADQFELEQLPYNPQAIINDVLSANHDSLNLKHLSVRVVIDENLPEMVTGDPVRIYQILSNLINNAVKFTPRGEIIISVQETVGDGEAYIQYEVKDTGIGIVDSLLGAIFQPFSQAHMDQSQKYGGSGLGLTICKHLVEMMGGVIEVESQVDKGSLFRLKLILRSDASHVAQVDETELLQNIHIIVAEDEPVNQLVISQILEMMGFSADIAENGQVLLSAMKDKSYDLILMDCQMPVMDGFEATRQVRKLDTPLRSIPIIAVTAHAIDDIKKKCFESGMNDFLTKPVRQHELKEKIMLWLSNNKKA